MKQRALVIQETQTQQEKPPQSRQGVKSVMATKVMKGAPSVERTQPPTQAIHPIQKKTNISVENVRPTFPDHNIPKKKKKVNKKKKLQVINLQEEEDQQRLLEEQQRREEIDQFRKSQYEKMSNEERVRLTAERDEALLRISRYEQELRHLQDLQQPFDEWQDYIKCSTIPNPRSERDLSVLLFQINEQKVELDCKLIVQKMEYAINVMKDIDQAKIEDLLLGKTQDIQLYDKYIEKISSLINQKSDQIAQLYVINFDDFLIANNQAGLLIFLYLVVTKFLSLPYNKQNNKQILANIANKPEERLKYEILKEWTNSESFKFGIWYNPISKAGYRIKPVEFLQINKLCIEIPRLYMSYSLIYKIHWFSRNLMTEEYDQYLTLGGVYVPECLELVQSAKRSSRWTLKPAFDDPEIFMKKLKYPPKFQSTTTQTKQSVYPPLRVQFAIPTTLYLPDCNNLFVVSYQKNEWTQEGIEELNIDLNKRQVNFQLPGMFPFTMAQTKSTDFPYKQWRICQVDKESVYVSLTTQRDIELQFVLQDKTIKLARPKQLLLDFPQLEGSMNPAQLMLLLRDIGINLMAQEQDGILCKSVFKLEALEEQALLNIVQGLDIVSFQSSKHNRNTPKNQIIFQIIENPQQKLIFQEDDLYKWKTIQNELDKCAFVKSKESDAEYTSDWMLNTLSHSNLYLLIQRVVPEDLVQTMEHITNVEFKENVKIFLKMTKILCIG